MAKTSRVSSILGSLKLKNPLVRESLAELLGTFVLIVFGDGVVAQVVLGKGEAGSYVSISMCWGLAVVMGVYVSGGVSGGHINPAVSLSMLVLGRMSGLRCVIYQVSQYVGAFLGAACVYLVYYDALNAFDGGVREVSGVNGTAGIFATYPQPYLSIGGCLVDQIVGTALLLIGVLAITDPRNMEVPKGVIPICVGLLVMAIGKAYGLNCGYSINPARDMSPRVFTSLAGWGTGVFTHHDHYFWVPWLGPYLGALVGSLIYQGLVGLHWPHCDDDEDQGKKAADEKSYHDEGGEDEAVGEMRSNRNILTLKVVGD